MAALNVDRIPPKGENLILPTPCQREETDRRNGEWVSGNRYVRTLRTVFLILQLLGFRFMFRRRRKAFSLCPGQGFTKTAELFLCQETFTPLLRVKLNALGGVFL